MSRPGDQVVRLTDLERQGILNSIVRAASEMGVIWRRVLLFGSRADPARRGGDIDLLVEIERAGDEVAYRLKQRLRIALEDELGEQKVDVVIDDGESREAFVGIARQQGVELWIND